MKGRRLMAVALAAAAALPVGAGETSVSFQVSVTAPDAAAKDGRGSAGAVCRADAETGAAGCVPAVPSTQWQWRPMLSSTGLMNLAGAALTGTPGPAAGAGTSDASPTSGAAGSTAAAGGSQTTGQATSAEPRAAADGAANYLELMISW